MGPELSEDEDLGEGRVCEHRVKGNVEQWQNKCGWIRPSDDLPPHVLELLEKEPKGVYVNWRDVADGIELELGQLVDFWLVGDQGGLSAEDVRPFEDCLSLLKPSASLMPSR